ncbi:MAG: hypothetical protein WCP81_03015 [Actinomycetes bacterium]|jgi:hypothetical protein
MGQDDDASTAQLPPSVRPAALLIVRITEQDVGRRVTIRHRIAEPSASLTDVVGHLRTWSNGLLVVERHTGEQVEIAEVDMVAAKVVPEKAVRRPRPQPPTGGDI